MKHIIICPHCGELHIAVPSKTKKDKIRLISTGIHLSDLSADFGTSAKAQNTKTTKKENK